MTARKRIYLTYLESGHWKALRLEAWKRDGFKCIKCGSGKNLHGHHRRYRKDFRLCTVDDIETLCEKCHSRHHKEKRAERRKNRKTRLKSHIASLIFNFSAT